VDLRQPLAPAAAAAPASAAVRRLPPVKFMVAGVAVLITFAYLVSTAMGAGAVYYLTVSELHAKGAVAYNTPVRVGGRAADGSLYYDTGRQTLRFILTDNSGTMPVVYTGIVPDMFGYAQDGHYQDAVVEGTLHPDGVFYATQIIVKHDARFAAADAAATAQAGASTGKPAP
jgi:cytochrome c-type biogenesis protein CcmE